MQVARCSGFRRRPRRHRHADGRGKDLASRTGQSRHDLAGEFVELCGSGGRRRGDILSQIRRLGCSCDFTREYYTSTRPFARGARAFSELYHQGWRIRQPDDQLAHAADVLSDLE